MESATPPVSEAVEVRLHSSKLKGIGERRGWHDIPGDTRSGAVG